MPGWEGANDSDWQLAGPPGRFYVDAACLVWWTKGQQLPALVTGGSPSDMPPGALGQPGTVELIGNSTVENDVRAGASFTAGVWLNEDQTLGVEASFLFLQPHSTQIVASSDGSTLLARPFFAVGTVTNPDGSQSDLAQEDALILANPGVSAGSVRVSTQNLFWGAEANARVNLCGDCFYRADLLVGFRFLELKDRLDISSVTDTTPSTGPVLVSDAFHTINRFYGGQIGADLQFWRGRWFVDLRGKFGLGAMCRVVAIDGATTFTAGGPTVVPGGLFAQPTNIGYHTNTDFGFVPEGSCRLGYQFTNYLSGYLGYSAIYLARNVVQPGNQIDRTVNVNQVASLGVTPVAPLGTDIRPAFAIRGTDWWAQGFQFGLELDF
jgi:hypothetical protein